MPFYMVNSGVNGVGTEIDPFVYPDMLQGDWNDVNNGDKILIANDDFTTSLNPRANQSITVSGLRPDGTKGTFTAASAAFNPTRTGCVSMTFEDIVFSGVTLCAQFVALEGNITFNRCEFIIAGNATKALGGSIDAQALSITLNDCICTVNGLSMGIEIANTSIPVIINNPFITGTVPVLGASSAYTGIDIFNADGVIVRGDGTTGAFIDNFQNSVRIRGGSDNCLLHDFEVKNCDNGLSKQTGGQGIGILIDGTGNSNTVRDIYAHDNYQQILDLSTAGTGGNTIDGCLTENVAVNSISTSAVATGANTCSNNVVIHNPTNEDRGGLGEGHGIVVQSTSLTNISNIFDNKVFCSVAGNNIQCYSYDDFDTITLVNNGYSQSNGATAGELIQVQYVPFADFITAIDAHTTPGAITQVSEYELRQSPQQARSEWFDAHPWAERISLKPKLIASYSNITSTLHDILNIDITTAWDGATGYIVNGLTYELEDVNSAIVGLVIDSGARNFNIEAFNDFGTNTDSFYLQVKSTIPNKIQG